MITGPMSTVVLRLQWRRHAVVLSAPRLKTCPRHAPRDAAVCRVTSRVPTSRASSCHTSHPAAHCDLNSSIRSTSCDKSIYLPLKLRVRQHHQNVHQLLICENVMEFWIGVPGNFMYNKIFSATKERTLVIKNIAVDPKMHACTALIIFTSREESIWSCEGGIMNDYGSTKLK